VPRGMDLSRMRCLVKIALMSSCAFPKKTCKLQLLCSYRMGDGGWGEGPGAKGRVWPGVPASSVCLQRLAVCVWFQCSKVIYSILPGNPTFNYL